jgi:hypothetical protein
MGLLSNRSGHQLLRIAKEQGALVRFVGDTRQHVAVEAGDFGRTLEQHSNLRSVSLSKIGRQRDPEYRAAVMEMASSKVTEGLARLDQKGWIHEEKSGYLIEAAKRYLELSEFGSKLVTERGEPHVLAVGPTHAEIRAFTADVRAAMGSAGALSGPVIKRRAFIAHDTTRAMRRDSNTYTPGTAVTLISEKTKVRGLSAREVYTFKETKKKDFVALVDAHGKEHTINVRANGEKLELGSIGEIELKAGDRLWFRANSSGVTNGTLASLAGTDEQERLVTTGGFVVPEDYLKIAHGYATTSHSSQGLTTNFAVVFAAAFDQKAIYVSHSRARERVDTYVPSKEAFLARAERAQGERMGVLEAIADARKKNGSSATNGAVKVGDKINWSYEPRGGYGYTQQIAGVVTRLGREKIQIRVAKRDNGNWVATDRWIMPDKLSGRVSRATPEEAAQLIEPETKSMDKIQLRQISDPERDQVQRAIIAEVETDPDLFIERYVALDNAFKGRYVAADLFKETFEAYRASLEARNRYNIPVHNAAATLAAEQLSRVLKEPRDPGRDTLLFLTGIPGSGKTSTVLFAGQLPPRCHAVYEGQLADARYAIPKIQAALDAGFKPVINVIHANPEIALDNTYLRFNEHGRGSGANAIAKIQADLPLGLAAIREHFCDQVDLVIHDRRTPEREQKLVGWTHLDIATKRGNL